MKDRADQIMEILERTPMNLWPIELVDEALTLYGYDPEQVGKDARQVAEDALREVAAENGWEW